MFTLLRATDWMHCCDLREQLVAPLVESGGGFAADMVLLF